ncbi:MAG TPA: RDD family protein [Acidobacteriaceae bacterium]|nr:RDD family protein [Acidobacteriaceae bacterium]
MQGSVGSAEIEGMAQGLVATGTDGAIFNSKPAALFETGAASLREAAAARVAAHRSKRAGAQAMDAAREEALRQEHARVARESRYGAAKVRDAVRARYEQSQSYRDFLAVEAERAMQQARAEAEVAARNAKAIADAQMQLLEELREEESAESFEVAGPALVAFEEERGGFEWAEHAPATPVLEEPAAWDFAESGDLFAEPDAPISPQRTSLPGTPVREISTGGLTVRMYDDVGLSPMPEPKARPRVYQDEVASEELEELEQEIAFRRAPEFEDHIIETLPLPANLIEFPRELVATRKARPRLAEGPLRDELPAEPQLRIFEVEPEQISTEPVAAEEIVAEAPVWQGTLLDAPRVRAVAPEREVAVAAGLADLAPISRRVMAAVVDGCCIAAALVGFATVAAYVSGPRLQGMSKPLLAGALVFTFAIAALLYQLLFFWLNEATPGMRYARIGLCTFAEANPTRKAMRRRVMAQMLAVGPLGLGVLWAWMDGDRLAWHDRISRTYQRMY